MSKAAELAEFVAASENECREIQKNIDARAESLKFKTKTCAPVASVSCSGRLTVYSRIEADEIQSFVDWIADVFDVRATANSETEKP